MNLQHPEEGEVPGLNYYTRMSETHEYLLNNGIILLEAHASDDDMHFFHAKQDLFRVAGYDYGRSEDKPISIFINTFGSNIDAAFSLYDQIIRMREDYPYIDTIVQGNAFSGGSIVLQAGRERLATPNSFIMIHDVQSSDIEGDTRTIQNTAQVMEVMQTTMLDIYHAHTGITRSKLSKIIKNGEYYMSAKEAVKMKFIDRVI